MIIKKTNPLIYRMENLGSSSGICCRCWLCLAPPTKWCRRSRYWHVWNRRVVFILEITLSWFIAKSWCSTIMWGGFRALWSLGEKCVLLFYGAFLFEQSSSHSRNPVITHTTPIFDFCMAFSFLFLFCWFNSRTAHSLFFLLSWLLSFFFTWMVPVQRKTSTSVMTSHFIYNSVFWLKYGKALPTLMHVQSQ